MDTEFLGAQLWRARTLACLMLTLLACSLGHAQSGGAQVTGSVTYRERMALPADAVIDVKLLDTTITDVASQTVAESLINAEGRQVPVPFTLGYDPSLIVPAHRYSVRAIIRSGDGMLMFSSTQAYPVITHGAPSKVNLVLQRVGHGAKPGGTAKKQSAPAPSETAESGSQPPPPPASGSTPAAGGPSAAVTTSAPPPSAAAPPPSAEQPPAEQPPVKQEAEQPAAAPANPPPNEQPSSTASTPPPAGPESTPAASAPAPSATPQAESAPSGNAPSTSETATQPSAPASTEQAPSTQAAAAPPEPPPASEPTPPAPAPSKTEQPTQPEPPASEEAQSAAPAPPPLATSAAPAEPAPAASDAKPAQPEAPLPEAPSATKGAELASRMPPTEGQPEPDSTSRPERPAPNKGLTPLADTQWKLVQLGGEDVVITPPQRPVTLSFSPEGRRIAGSAGCNSYLGTFTDDHGNLQMHPGSMTMMFCADPAGSREKKFIAMLRSADGYKMNETSLQLTHNGKVVAKFINNPDL